MLERNRAKMSEGSTFPIFIRPELQDGSPAFAEFVRRAGSASKQAADSFKADFREVTNVISNAVTKGVQGGKLDLDVSQLKQASAEAKLFQEALNGTLRTAQLLAAETGDTSTETRQYILALESASKAQDENRRGIETQIATYSRLQAALDVTADKNSKLAAAYRETFAEAARLARVEVDNRSLGAAIAPAMGARATDNGASYSALAELQDKLIRQEELYGQIAKRNQQAVAGAVDFNRRATEQYATALAQLKTQLDPIGAAQAELNRELSFAAEAFRRGDITAEQYQTRVTQLSVVGKQLTETHRALRQASLQAGQQLQDVAISLYSGQQASVVFAQQLPQLAFALSGLEGSANKTHNRIGQFATFLSGPWGVAVGLGVGVLGTLVANLLDTDDAASKAEKTTYDFSKALDFSRLSVGQLSDAIGQLNQQTEKLISTQARFAEVALSNAQTAVSNIDKRLADIRREIDALGPERTSGQQLLYGFDVATERRRAELSREYNTLQKDRDDAIASVNAAQINLAQRAVEELTDVSSKLKGEYDRAVADLVTRRTASQASEQSTGVLQPSDYISKAEFDRQILSLKQRYDRDIKSYRDSQRTTTPRRSPQQAMNDFIRELESRGIDVISGYRTASKQNSLYRQGLTPLDGYKRPSAHQAYRAVDVDKNTLREDQAYAAAQAAGIKGLKIVTESGGRKHLEFKGYGAAGEVDYSSAQKDAEKAVRAQEQLNRAIDQSSDSVARLRGEFDRAPREIDRANAAADRLNEEIAKAEQQLKGGGLTEEQRKIVEATKKMAEDTRDNLLPDFKARPVADELDAMQQQVDLQRLLLQGRRGEHDIVQDQIDLVRLLGGERLDELETLIKSAGISDAQLETYYQQRAALRGQNIELEKQQEKQQQLLQIVDDIQSATKSAIFDFFDGKGLGAAKSFINDLYDITKRQLTEEIFTAVLGDSFTNQKLKILGLDQVDKTGREMASAIRVTIDPIRDLGNVAAEAVRQIRGAGAANDNSLIGGLGSSKSASKSLGGLIPFSEDIVVNGYRSIDNVGAEIKRLNKTTSDGLGKGGALAKGLGGFGDILSGALRGAAMGEAASGFLKSIGVKSSKTGGQIGGAIGSLSDIPGADIAGSFIGSIVGGFFKKTPKGSSTITGLGETTYSGSGKLRAGVTGLAGGVQDQLSQIIDTLGGDLGNFAVSIGQRKKKFTVDPTGKGRTKGAGVQSYATEAEAQMAALRDAILDGAVKGIRAGAQRLLQSGKDLDKQLAKAVDFQNVFDRLKEIDDPVGAAVDKIDRDFNRLRDIFTETGASASEFAELERLYGIDRAAAIKEANEKVVGSLKSLLDELTVGDNGRSIRDRLSAAQTAYDPLKARVLAGDKTAYDEYAQAARTLLDIQREFSGSQLGYFNLLDEVTSITKERIAAEEKIVALATDRDSPFASNGAANDNYAPVVGAIEQQTADLLRGFASIMYGSGSSAYVDIGRFLNEPFR